MTSDKPVDNKTRTTSTSFAETLRGENLCCFYYLAVVRQSKQYATTLFLLPNRQCPVGQRPSGLKASKTKSQPLAAFGSSRRQYCV
jgi:hypothetical protein